MSDRTNRQGRGWAYTGAILGGAVSIAANIAHSYVPPKGAPADWSPHLGAVVGAVFWPVALFVAIEILARVAWPAGRRWTALRFLGLLPVALVAAVVSYRHLSGLLAFYGEDGLTVVIGPLAVDGLMVMATGALIATGQARGARTHTVGTTIEDAPAVTLQTADGDVSRADATKDAHTVRLPAAAALEASAVADTTAATPTARRPAKRQTAADRVARAAARTPAASPAQLAARLKLSERTVQRYMPRPADDTTPPSEQPSEQLNGATVAALVTTD